MRFSTPTKIQPTVSHKRSSHVNGQRIFHTGSNRMIFYTVCVLAYEKLSKQQQKFFSALLATLCSFQVYVGISVVRVLRSENLFPHSWQQKGFLQCVFACAWSGCRKGKIFFHTPGNNKVFLQCVFACAWSARWTGKIFFHTPGNNKVFPSVCSHVLG